MDGSRPDEVAVVSLTQTAIRTRIQSLTESNISQAGICREAGLSTSALSRWLKGEYPGNVVELERKLSAYLDARDARQSTLATRKLAPDWVGTETALRVISALRFAHLFGVLALIYGGAGVGKTRAARRYAATAPSTWLATMTAASKNVVSCLQVIVAALGIKDAQGGALTLFRAIVARVSNSRGLLVIDEAQHLSIDALEQIRAISDETGVGIVLMGNEQVYARMAGGARSPFLDRLHSRVSKRLKLGRPTPADSREICSSYGLTDASSLRLAEQIAAKPGALRVLATALDLAQSYASAASESLTSAHLQLAWTELAGEA